MERQWSAEKHNNAGKKKNQTQMCHGTEGDLGDAGGVIVKEAENLYVVLVGHLCSDQPSIICF